jgi:cysteine desulfurase
LGSEDVPSTSGASAGGLNAAQQAYIEMKGIRLMGAPIYLDMQATTPTDPRVLDAMLPFMTDEYGNPHSRTHMYGWESEDAVEVARKQVQTILATSRRKTGSNGVVQCRGKCLYR